VRGREGSSERQERRLDRASQGLGYAVSGFKILSKVNDPHKPGKYQYVSGKTINALNKTN